MKRALYVSPHNFFERKSGAHHGAYQIATLLNKAGFKVDQFAMENFESKWDDLSVVDRTIVDELFLFDLSDITQSISKKRKHRNLLNLTNARMKKYFIEKLKNKRYDLVVFDYVFWGELINQELPYPIYKLLILHDLLSVQQIDHHQNAEAFREILNDELNRIAKFDGGFATSHVEKAFLSMGIPHLELCYLPLTSGIPNHVGNIDFSGRSNDVLFVGFQNIHNVRSMKWFVSKVVPLLKNEIKIQIVGSVNKSLGNLNIKNIAQEPFVSDLSTIYNKTKLTICPMFSGSGTKVKIIESLSYGVPVVCNERSLYGFRDFHDNGCQLSESPEDFANAIDSICSSELVWKRMSALAEKYYTTEFSPNIVENRGISFLQGIKISNRKPSLGLLARLKSDLLRKTTKP